MKSLGISNVNYVCRHYGGTVLEEEVVEIVGEWTSALGDHIMEVLPMDSESRDETVVIKAYNIHRMSPEEVLDYYSNNLECSLWDNPEYGGETVTLDYIVGYLKALKDIKEAVK